MLKAKGLVETEQTEKNPVQSVLKQKVQTQKQLRGCAVHFLLDRKVEQQFSLHTKTDTVENHEDDESYAAVANSTRGF